MDRKINFGRLLHGGDYNPEQWLHMPEILDRDVELMKKANINAVSLGIFSWAALEPEEGMFHFDWMEQIIDRLYQNGISVILATPTGARPKWMADKYEEVLRVDAMRRRQLFGARHNHCYTSPVYREKTRIINTELAKRFGKHPGVIAWHISNEYGGECYCPLCQNAFRSWLKEKYKSIDNLNLAWATTFWSHRYQDFSQIESPSPIGESGLHALNLDWNRFVTHQTVDFMKHEIKAIRDAGSEKPATTNMMYDFQGLNYHKFADAVDFISWDAYPDWYVQAESETAFACGMQHDIMRSIQKKPFLLMESCPSGTNWQPISKLKKPGLLHAASMQAIAHGADSVLYFQFRKSQGASEKFHGAVVDHYGSEDTRVFREVTEVGVSLKKLREVAGANTKAKIAIIHDWESRWAMENAQGPRNQGLHYLKAAEKSYSAFRRQGFDVDVIDMEQSIDGYAIVAAPMLYMFRDGFEEKIRKYVENGGRFILTYWSGIVDETDLCFLGGTPHGLMDVMGLRSTEIDGLFDWESNCAVPAEGNHMGLTKNYTCKNLCELVRPSTANVLMTYGEDFYAGMPALTENSFGSGKAYYICADFEQAFFDDVYEKIIVETDIHGVVSNVPAGIEVTTRENDAAEYVFIQSFNRHGVEIDLPMDKYEILMGAYDGTIPAFGTIVLKRSK